jgi:hypothetical protein
MRPRKRRRAPWLAAKQGQHQLVRMGVLVDFTRILAREEPRTAGLAAWVAAAVGLGLGLGVGLGRAIISIRIGIRIII